MKSPLFGTGSAWSLEAFVHGAVPCLLGTLFALAQMTGRSANLGDSAQSCRWSYALVEAKRPGGILFPSSRSRKGATS